ncbi:MAG TPA: hypothetical protein VLA87_11600 [Gaiellaceae bacterium]|nr:hypothetical protein [Gaiellaceae bacterium]
MVLEARLLGHVGLDEPDEAIATVSAAVAVALVMRTAELTQCCPTPCG